MKKLYIKLFLTLNILIASFLAVGATILQNSTLADSTKSTLKLSDRRPERPTFIIPYKTDFESFMLKTSLAKNTAKKNPTSKSLSKAITLTNNDIIKSLENVKVYPNPVADQLNVSYTIKKDSNVTIKIMDVLGNEITTLMSQRQSAGEQTSSFNLSAKLSSGFYFVRLTAGTDSVIKRISVQ